MARGESAAPHRANSAGVTLRTAPSPRRSKSGAIPAIFRRSDAEELDDGGRRVALNAWAENTGFVSNELKTAKYTPLNLVPKALFEQFRRVSNFYFTLIAAISFIPDVSPTSEWASVLPLFVVVGFGFARDVYEDVKRAIGDRVLNNTPVVILRRMAPDGGEDKLADKGVRELSLRAADGVAKYGLNPESHGFVASRDVAVGDIVFVRKGETFPADMVLVLSSAEGGVAFVSTANLDGESNLKRQVVATATSDVSSLEELQTLPGVVRAQDPSTALHEFDARMSVASGEFTPLDTSNLLLRGSILRNTDYIYGLVVYTGFDSKVALNMRNPPSKMGSVELKLNWVVAMLFLCLAALVIVGSVISGVLQDRFGEGQWYMGSLRLETGRDVGVRGLGTFLILFSTFIPVSLFVTLEFVRLFQAIFMQADIQMKTNGKGAAARATNLNEMLGTVNHILSDKTGTLTENIMRYVACSAGGVLYNTRTSKRPMEKAVSAGAQPVKDLILAMALCHSAVPEPKDSESDESGDAADMPGGGKKKRKHLRKALGISSETKAEDGSLARNSNSGENHLSLDNDADESPPEYQGQSPDEVALVTSAREYGVTLVKRSIDTLFVNHFGVEESYTAMAELEFNSDRKRMSMIFRCPDNSIRMYTKGADTIMVDLLRKGTDIETIQDHIDRFAVDGLRTLVFASKTIPQDEFEAWFVDFQEARNSLTDREAAVSAVSARLEQDLDYIAVTAVEDKLQDKVPETIKFMREAGVRLWVLTGDKRETAENIGYSANLLDKKMDVVHIRAKNSNECREQLQEALDKYDLGGDAFSDISPRRSSLTGLHRGMNKKHAGVQEKALGIIIDGASLAYAIEDHTFLLMDLSDHAKSVICCRVTPLQKALVVRMVRETRSAMTLAIGDGGNDVSMIQEAHIGVGLYGKEGTQAARAGDYALGEFKHLLRLMAVHGRYSMVRTSGMINLSFYKNIFFTLTQVFFQIFNFVSGTTFHDQWVATSLNVVVTSLSPLLYGMFERDLDESTLMRFPSVYATNREKQLFSLISVGEYTLLYGAWHAIVVFFGVYLAFGYLKISFTDGKDSGLYLTGFVTTTIAVFMILFKFVLHSRTLNSIIIGAIALSIAIYFTTVPLSIWIVKEFPLEGQLAMMFRSPAFYLCAFVIFCGGYVMDFTVLMIRRLLFPDVISRLQGWERQQEVNMKRLAKGQSEA